MYGYGGAWDRSTTMDVSPVLVRPQNAWGLQDVRFTDAECRDYISRFCEKSFKDLSKEDASCLEQYVHNLTDGHPGLVAYFMHSIEAQFRQERKYPEKTTKVSWPLIFKFLKSHDYFISVMLVSVLFGFKVT